RQGNLDATQKENLRKAMTHMNGVAATQKEVEGLRQKLAAVKLTVDQQRKLKNDPEAAAAALEERKAKVRAALANAEERLTGHRRKLAAVLGFNKPTRVDPAQVRRDRAAFFSGVVEKQGSRGLERGERLGPRAIGPVTRPEVFAPREMRTGSEESRAGETTTQPDTRLKEALGVRQRDVPMTRKEQAEANMIAAENAVEAAKTPSEKRLAEAQLAVAEIRYDIAAKGDSNTRAQLLAEAELALERLQRTRMAPVESFANPLRAREEALVAKELAGEPEVKGKRKPEQNVDSFLKSLKRITKASKKEKGLRAFGDVDVDVKKGVFDAPGKSAYISLIRNNGVKGKGAASTVLKKLMALADKHGVTLTLQPQKVGAKGLSTEQLEAWYAKSGFKSWDGGMYREPKNIQDKVGEAPAYEAPEIEILGGPREDVFFSRGETAAPSTTATVRAELGKVFPDLGRVQIYDSVDALVQANPQYKGRIPADARGFVDSAGNKAFLIAENIDQGRALGVLLHEVGSHIGLKNTLGEAQYNALVKAVQTWAKKTDGSPEAKVAQAALARVEAAQTPASQRADETLAYAIEEAVNAGVKPMETKSVLGQWLSRVAQLFRRALEKFGLPPKALDAQGLVDMAFGAAKMEMRGMRPAGGVKQNPVRQRMYHGSPDTDISVLTGLVFYAPSRSVAQQYANNQVFGTGKGASGTGRVYEDIVSTENTLDMRKQEHRALYDAARKKWNTFADVDDRLPPLTSEGFVSTKTGVPSFGYAQRLLAAMPEFDSVWLDEGSQGLSLAVQKPDEILFSRKTDYAPGLAAAGKVS
ncbi:MAG: hypothetical protein ACO32I_07600, partial [Candidatus Limnocylindrus sp.]